ASTALSTIRRSRWLFSTTAELTIRGGGMPYSNLALDADRKNGPAARSFAADAHDRIMVRIKPSYRIQVCSAKMRAHGELPSDPLQTGTTGARSYAKSPSQFIVAARAQASRRCETQAPLSGKPLALLPFRSLDPFRAYREADRRRRDEERGFPAPNKEPPTNQKHDLTGKAPYKFVPASLRQRWPLPPGGFKDQMRLAE